MARNFPSPLERFPFMSPEDRIVPKSRDQDAEPLPNIGNIVPDRDDAASYHRQKASRPKASASAGGEAGGGHGRHKAVTSVLGVLVLALVGCAAFLYQQLTLAQERVGVLEQKLSVTDESVNQSSVSMQVKLKDLDAALTQVRDETLKQYKGLIDKHTAQIDALDKASKNAQAALAKLDQRTDEHDKQIADTRAQVEKIPPTVDQAKRKLDEHDAAFAAVNGKLKSLGDAQGKADSRLNNNDEWVESINTFRKQMNREIVNIKQQVAGGKPPAPSEAPLP